MCPYLLLKRASPQRTGNKQCKKWHWDSCHLQGLPGYIWREDSFSIGKKMVGDLHLEHHSLNFLLKNYISKKIFQHVVGTYGEIKRSILLSSSLGDKTVAGSDRVLYFQR